MSTIESPAPARMTTRFDVRAVVRTTASKQSDINSSELTYSVAFTVVDEPFPAALSSDHFFSGFTSPGLGGVIPKENGPAESSRRAARCLWSRAFARRDCAVGRLLPAAELVLVLILA